MENGAGKMQIRAGTLERKQSKSNFVTVSSLL